MLNKHAHLNRQAPVQQSPRLDRVARAWAFFIGAPTLAVKPRAQCHRLSLDVKGIPRQMLQSSIRLQVGHITGLACFGFAWRLTGKQAEVWYWPEEPEAAKKTGVVPCPEPLLRAVMSDGLHLVTCLSGFEGMAVVSGTTRTTRWFAAVPSDNTWRQFARDAGLDPTGITAPTPRPVELLAKPAKGWQLVSNSLQPISIRKWTVWAVATAGGAIFFALLAYNAKLLVHTNNLRQEYDSLAQQAASTLKLQREIEVLQQPIQAIAQSQPKVLQIKLMAQLAQAGLFDEASKVNLQEWEYRNGRIRMQFSVPAEGFELGGFLESVERLGLFKNVRLLSGTPPNSVAVQAELASVGGVP